MEGKNRSIILSENLIVSVFMIVLWQLTKLMLSITQQMTIIHQKIFVKRLLRQHWMKGLLQDIHLMIELQPMYQGMVMMEYCIVVFDSYRELLVRR